MTGLRRHNIAIETMHIPERKKPWVLSFSPLVSLTAKWSDTLNGTIEFLLPRDLRFIGGLS